MRTGFKWAFWSALALMALTASAMIAILTDLSFFRSSPLLFILILAGIVTGSGLMIRNRYYLPVLRNLRFSGKLLMAPLVLLALTVPAAIIYIYYDLTGNESLLLLSGLFTSFGAAFFLSSLAVVSLPAMGSVLSLVPERTGMAARIMAGDPWKQVITSAVGLAVLLVAASRLAGFSLTGAVIMLPLAAIAMMLLDIVIVADFRDRMTDLLSPPHTRDALANGKQTAGMPERQDRALSGTVEGFRNVMLVEDHYLDLISGRLDYLTNHAGDGYAAEIIAVAARTFDPALIAALKVISDEPRFSSKTRKEAGAGATVLEKYYSDPVRNRDLLRLPGIPEKTVVARSIMLGKGRPYEQDIIKLLGDPSAEIRRTGLIAAGRYNMTGLKTEVIRALSNPETDREAFYTLRQFGHEVYGEVIGTAIRPGNREAENNMILELLNDMPLMEALPWLSNFVGRSTMGVRLKAARMLCDRGWKPQGKNRQRIEEILSETLHAIARIMAMQSEAGRNKSFLLAASLKDERQAFTDFLFSLLVLVAGRDAATVIMNPSGNDDSYRAGIASEAIETVIDPSVRRPLRALLGNHNDHDRLAELSLLYPVRSPRGRSLASLILSSEQTTTGTWTKACALHKAAMEGKGLDREQVVSYLFSNSMLLQEESASVIRVLNPEWYSETEARLKEPARSRISALVSGTLPMAATIFEKTRFLSLCFNNIPEEKMIMLATGMRFSESYDATSIPGVISWIVPSGEGKTGLYSLPVDDIASYLFYYSEFTDIFVNYIDKQGGLAVS